jgi:hypothetical protein
MVTRRNKYVVEVRILQNGATIKELELPFKPSRLISLSSRESDPLGLNLYPLSRDIPILKIEKDEAKIFIDHAWEGFIVCKGEMKDVLPNTSLGDHYTIYAGDYASIAWHDLRLLVYIREPQHKIQSRFGTDSRYLLSPFSTMIRDRFEGNAILGAILLGGIIFASFWKALTSQTHVRPTQFDDLTDPYTLPFISSETIRIAPELLQESLDRAAPLKSILAWHQNYLNNAFAWKTTSNVVDHQVLGQRAKEEWSEISKDLSRLKDTYDSSSLTILESPIAAQVKLKSIVGPTFSQRAKAVLERFDYITQNADMRLESKKKFISEFKADTGYNWDDYQRKAKTGNSDAMSQLAGNAFNVDKEKKMYKDFQALSELAKDKQELFLNSLQDKNLLADTSGVVIRAEPGVVGLSGSAIPSINLSKLARMPVSEFNSKTKPKKPVEPLSGKIDQVLLKNALLAQRMEIQLCYEASLRRNLANRGKMRWEWVLDTEGQITDIQLVRSEIPDNDLARCVRRKISVFKLPKPRLGSVRISHIFEFRPEKNL